MRSLPAPNQRIQPQRPDVTNPSIDANDRPKM